MGFKEITFDLKKAYNVDNIKKYSRFFKTGKGEYGEGDIFWGISIPEQRSIAKKHLSLSLNEIQKLLKSKVHEQRLTGLLVLVEQFKKSNDDQKKAIYSFYLDNIAQINNWDLVDLSAYHIIGNYILDKDKSILYQLAKSKIIWERRVAIISTWIFIRNNQFQDSLKISKMLLNDNHDLIHKAVGWMLREVGKRDLKTLELFLKEHYRKMPRTMLRYSIEKFPEQLRQSYLKSKI